MGSNLRSTSSLRDDATPRYVCWIWSFALAIASGCSTPPAAAGGEREPCYGNGTCDAPLVCASAVCVSLPDAGRDASAADAGDAGVELDTGGDLDATTDTGDASAVIDGAVIDANAGDAADGAADDSDTIDAGVCAPHPPTCVAEQTSALDLFTTVSTRAIVEEAAPSGEHVSHVDAMGGGSTPTESYVYARFTDAGLVRVDVSDADAFASTDWDIAFRRFIIRLNSGVSGPSCVLGARTTPGTTFDAVTVLPSGLSLRSENYMTDTTCDVVADGSGLGSPATVLSTFWTYPGCISMTHDVYVLEARSGRHVKLEVLDYYLPADQAACDATGAMPTMTGSSGNIRVRWAFLD